MIQIYIYKYIYKVYTLCYLLLFFALLVSFLPLVFLAAECVCLFLFCPYLCSTPLAKRASQQSANTCAFSSVFPFVSWFFALNGFLAWLKLWFLHLPFWMCDFPISISIFRLRVFFSSCFFYVFIVGSMPASPPVAWQVFRVPFKINCVGLTECMLVGLFLA